MGGQVTRNDQDASLFAKIANNLSDLASAATAFANIKQAATTSATGVVERATTAEVRDPSVDSKFPAVKDLYDAAAEVTLTDGASIAWDLDTGINFVVTLAGNRTLANPTNAVPGKTGRIRVVQDATGSRTLAYGANIKKAAGDDPILTTTASAEDVLYYDVISATKILISPISDIKA